MSFLGYPEVKPSLSSKLLHIIVWLNFLLPKKKKKKKEKKKVILEFVFFVNFKIFSSLTYAFLIYTSLFRKKKAT